jgi:hypothetical protein
MVRDAHLHDHACVMRNGSVLLRSVFTTTWFGVENFSQLMFSSTMYIKMDVVMLYTILEYEADEELLLLANNFRNENHEMFSQRSREGCFSTLISNKN